jgi:hypothetical protein
MDRPHVLQKRAVVEIVAPQSEHRLCNGFPHCSQNRALGEVAGA